MITWKDGELDLILRTLYTVPPEKTQKLLSIEIVNTSTSTLYLDLYVEVNGVNRRILPVLQELKAGFKLEDDLNRTLNQGSKIKGIATGAGLTYLLQLQDV
jgi:hypothetical protein